MKKLFGTTCFLFLGLVLSAQSQLPHLDNVEKVVMKNYWGDQKITGKSKASTNYTLSVLFTGTSEKKQVPPSAIKDYINVYKENKVLYIMAREPKAFESIDLILEMPSHMLLTTELIKGGNIYAENLDKGIEVNSLNGSVKLEKIGSYALVSAANGEVTVQFEHVDPTKAISLITLNGGVTVELPATVRRDLRLVSRKNGYINSDFELQSDTSIENLNTTAYSKRPIIESATINGGGELLFLSTQNGPLTIKKWK